MIEITENLCEFICYNLATQNIHSLSKLTDYSNIVENLETIATSETIEITKTLIHEIRYKLLNDKLEENFDVDIFLELYESKELSINSYIKSIRNTLKENKITMDSLFELINSTTENDETIENIANLVGNITK